MDRSESETNGFAYSLGKMLGEKLAEAMVAEVSKTVLTRESEWQGPQFGACGVRLVGDLVTHIARVDVNRAVSVSVFGVDSFVLGADFDGDFTISAFCGSELSSGRGVMVGVTPSESVCKSCFVLAMSQLVGA